MVYRTRIKYTAARKAEIRDRWQRGESLTAIGRLFDRPSSSIYNMLAPSMTRHVERVHLAGILGFSAMVQSPHLDPAEDPQAMPQPIHLGFRLGTSHLRTHLKSLEEIGSNHVALNLRFNQADTEETLKRLASDILPHFPGPDSAG